MKPRACLLCYRRKIKCDRKQPCTNCVYSNESCSFPQWKIRRNRPRRKAGEAPLIEKRIAVSETRLEEPDNPTSSSTTTEDHEYMVVDSTSQSRLLASNAWANVKEEVLDLHTFRSFQVLKYSPRKIISKTLFSTYPERICQRRGQSSSCSMQTKVIT